MDVVYSPRHLAHDIDTETYMGIGVPANEVAERAERIRTALEADGGFRFMEPTEHGEEPISAVHDPGLVRFLETAWSELRAQNVPRSFLSADTYPNRAMFEGMSDEAIARLVREPRQIGGRAGFWGLDSAAPLVAGTYDAARAAVDVALTTLDRVLAGAPMAYGLCRPPGHHAARSMYGGYCFFNNAAIVAESLVLKGARRVAILDVDYHHGNGTQQIFWERGDVLYISLHADPARAFPYFSGHADEVGAGAGKGFNYNIPLAARTDIQAYAAALERACAIVERTGEPVAILDVDFHHGNGTQQIFWRRGDVRYVSIHADPDRQYPYFLGHAEETGEGDGAGANRNLPLRAGATNADYLAATDQAIDWIAEAPGSIVVVSLGFDTYGLDPIGDFALTTEAYHEVGRRVAALGRRLVILQEGGYHRPSLGENARAWLRGAERPPFDPLPSGGFGERGTVA